VAAIARSHPQKHEPRRLEVRFPPSLGWSAYLTYGAADDWVRAGFGRPEFFSLQHRVPGAEAL